MEGFNNLNMEDFNVPSARRAAVLGELQEAIGVGVPPWFWAACQICHITSLNKLLVIAGMFPNVVLIVSKSMLGMVIHWTQSTKGSWKPMTPKKANPSTSASSPTLEASPAKRQKTSDPPTNKTGPLSPMIRSQRVRNLAFARDGNRCAITSRTLACEVAHIFPYHLLKHQERDPFGARIEFWRYLGLFWPKEKLAAWQAELFPNGLTETGVEGVYNMITMTRDLHVYWNRGVFALKPVSINKDKTVLKIQFYWQAARKDSGSLISLQRTPPCTKDLSSYQGVEGSEDHYVVDKSGRFLKSGYEFEVTTDDPQLRPLPSFALLELQWFLTRVVGMAGAAIPHDPQRFDSDDNVPNLELSDEEDERFMPDDEQLQTT